MANFAPVGSSTTTTSVEGSTVRLTVNVPMPLANTEYSYSLPSGTQKFLIKTREGGQLQVTEQSGQSGTTYITVPRNCSLIEDNLTVTGLTLYFQSSSANQTAELIIWT